MNKTILYLIRHGEAFGNVNRVFQGSQDGDLSENGKRQLERLARRFEGVPLDAVYASPLVRAQKTARAVAGPAGLPVATVPELAEIHGGDWEGQPWSRLPELFPEESEHWAKRPWLFHPPGGESMREVYDRMRSILSALASRHPGGSLAAVSHGCAIRNAICWARGWPVERVGEIDWCDNTAVTVLEFENGHPKLLLENDNSHLDGETSRLAGQTWWRAGSANPFA